MILFFDTETTGVLGKKDTDITRSQNWPRVVSLAWAIVDAKQGVVAHAHRLIKPEGWTIPKEATACHGITTEHASRLGSPGAEVWNELLEAIRKYKPVLLVAHNLVFDLRMTLSELYRSGCPRDEFAQIPTCCTLQNSIQFCAIPGKYKRAKWPRLEELHTKLFGVGFPDAHDAMIDVQALIRCYCGLCQRGQLASYPKLPFPENLDRLAQ